MFAKWSKPRRYLLAIGAIVISWASIHSESIASGEFLTDRIGAGSVLKVREAIPTAMDGRILYFQDGHPVSLAQLHAEQPYCRFQSQNQKLSKVLSRDGQLVVRFRNVARARWFFGENVQLECSALGTNFRESDFNQALGSYFHVEKRSSSIANGVTKL